jgi:polysaccharide export outer membrane protein
MRNLLLLAAAAALLSSCISTKRLTYLQDLPGKPIELDSNGFQPYYLSEYRLQKNDLLQIQIKTFNEETDKYFNYMDQTGGMGRMGMMGGGGGSGNPMLYYMGYNVDVNGLVQLPVLGSVRLEGLTLPEAEAYIHQLLKTYFNDNLLFVKVQLGGIRYTVIGEGGQREVYYFNNQLNILQALAAGGGGGGMGGMQKSIYSDLRRVQIFRQFPQGYQMFELDLTDRRIISDPNFFVQPNDIINIRPLPQRTWGIGEQGIPTILSAVSLITTSLTFYFFIVSLRPSEE